jgi:hypothetical protein
MLEPSPRWEHPFWLLHYSVQLVDEGSVDNLQNVPRVFITRLLRWRKSAESAIVVIAHFLKRVVPDYGAMPEAPHPIAGGINAADWCHDGGVPV